jgi:hypothetical protein
VTKGGEIENELNHFNEEKPSGFLPEKNATKTFSVRQGAPNPTQFPVASRFFPGLGKKIPTVIRHSAKTSKVNLEKIENL